MYFIPPKCSKGSLYYNISLSVCLKPTTLERSCVVIRLVQRSMCARIIVESNVCSMPHPHGQHASEATYIKELGLPCRNTIEKRIKPKEMLTFVME